MSSDAARGDVELEVVIPVYNEEAIVRENVLALKAHLDRVASNVNWRYILVDNGSDDRTREIIVELLDELGDGLYVFEGEPNYGRAIRAGLNASAAPFVHICDIEQWDIPFLAWAWRNRQEHDYFIGSRRSDPTIQKPPFVRRLLSWGLNALIQLFFSYMGTDTHGPKLINMSAMRPIIDSCVCDRGQFDSEIVLRGVRAGRRIAEAPIEHREHRPPKFRIVKKIGWNIVAFTRLRKVLSDVPYEGLVRFRQYNRWDVLEAYERAGLFEQQQSAIEPAPVPQAAAR